MLEETVLEWTREWKEEGWKKGRQEGSLKILLSLLEERFGTLPGEVLEQVKALRDPAELEGLAKRLLKAASLDDLGLG